MNNNERQSRRLARKVGRLSLGLPAVQVMERLGIDEPTYTLALRYFREHFYKPHVPKPPRPVKYYLSGPIDLASDGGITWRAMIGEWLIKHNGLVFDPTLKSEQSNAVIVRQLRDAGRYGEAAALMKPICDVDLQAVKDCDVLLCHIDLTIPSFGTLWELTIAHSRGKRICIHVQQGKQSTPLWFLGMIDHQHIFGSWDDIKAYLASPVSQPGEKGLSDAQSV